MKMYLVLFVAIMSGLPQLAEADYVMSVLHEGDSSVVVVPGSRFTVAVELSSNGMDQHNSAIFRVVFSDPGLVLEGYTWGAPYENGTVTDFSTPRLNTLPQLIDADTYDNGDSAVDMYMSNVNAAPFGIGTLLTLDVLVPADYAGPNQVSLQVVPDTLSLGFPPAVPTISGPVFTVNMAFRILGLVVTPGVNEGVLSWNSQAGLIYDVFSAAVPGGTETNVLSNILGQPNITSKTVPLTDDYGVFRVQRRSAP